jgi:hypothetical protein
VSSKASGGGILGRRASRRWRETRPARKRTPSAAGVSRRPRSDHDINYKNMASDLSLPGQPIPIPRGPAPVVGSGIYSREGQVRASVVGVPRYEGSVGVLPLLRWNIDANDALFLG